MTVNKRKVALQQEREFAIAFDLELTPGSGSTWHSKDDARSACDTSNPAKIRTELKGVAGGTYSLDPRVFLDLEKRAVTFDSFPVVGIRFYRGRPHAVNICVVDSGFPTRPEDGIRRTVMVETKSHVLTPFLIGQDFHTELVWPNPPRWYYKVPKLLVLTQASVERTIHELRSSQCS